MFPSVENLTSCNPNQTLVTLHNRAANASDEFIFDGGLFELESEKVVNIEVSSVNNICKTHFFMHLRLTNFAWTKGTPVVTSFIPQSPCFVGRKTNWLIFGF